MWVWGQYVWSKKPQPWIDPEPQSNLERWLRIIALIVCLVIAVCVLIALVVCAVVIGVA